MSWEQLQAIITEARADAMSPPPVVACWLCGEPLDAGPHGEPFCPFDGWKPGQDGA